MIGALLDRLRDLARRGRVDADAATGRRGEDLAHRFLQRQGYTVVARNYRTPSGTGEIDLVAWDGPTLVFVEVKTRASEEFGTPDRAVDSEKERHLLNAARSYAHRAGVEMERARFDIVSVVLGEPPRLALIRDAFRTSQTI